MSTIAEVAAATDMMLQSIPVDQKLVYLASVGNMSIHHHDSKVIIVPRLLAARYLAKRTHRLATAQETQDYDAAERRAKHEAESTRQLPISAETIAAVARAVNDGGNRKAGKGE